MKITVFTPSFNRAYIIQHLYESLKHQTFKDFEWLVVDDGSTDGTDLLFAQWIDAETVFPIRYFWKENGGKCSAINYGLELAQGELFFTVDSDDYLTNDALEKIVRWELELPKTQKYCGLAGNLGTAVDQTSNSLFSNNYYDGTALDRYGVVDGERAMVFYTDVHRKYPYPLFPGERFMTEAITWNRMANDGYKMRFFNDIIWIYEYKEDGLTKSGSKLFLNNPFGYGLFLREKAKFQHKSAISWLKMWYTFTCDLSEKYSTKSIAAFIGVPSPIIGVLLLVHKMLHIKK